jgi:hemerythrin-like domain-containing protein
MFFLAYFESRKAMKCIELVIQDHVILRRALDILDAMVQRMKHGERIEIADAMTIAQFIRLFGVEYHQTMEEKVLFPAVLHGVPQDSPIRHILFEHTEQRALIAAMDIALKVRRGSDFVRNALGVIALLRNHFDREDICLREITSSSKEEDDALVAEVMKNRKPPESYANFSALEWKYAPSLRGSARSAGHPLARAHTSHAR